MIWRTLRSPVLPRLASALVVSAVVEVGLHVTGVPTLARLLGVALATDGSTPAPEAGQPLGRTDEARYHAVRHVMRVWPWGRNGQCLRLALAAGYLLRHREPVLHLGVAHVGGRTVAHAWIAVDGLELDPTAGSYVRLIRPAA